MIERDLLRFIGRLHDAVDSGQLLDSELCLLASTQILPAGGIRVLLRAGAQTRTGWLCLDSWLGDWPVPLCDEMAERDDSLAQLEYWAQRLRLVALALGLTWRQGLPTPLLNPLKT